MLTITKKYNRGDLRPKARKVIFITARVHAGETYSSFIMERVLKEIITQPLNYDNLLRNCVLKFVPMLNVDGTIVGNSRASLAGVDLNRRWTDPH